MSLLADVVRVLRQGETRFALIGAAAMAVRGVSRATVDVDLLTLDAGVLHDDVWKEFTARGTAVRILKGDLDDPLAGSVRLAEDDEIVDVVIGRWDWQREIVEAAETLSVGPASLPVAAPAGLILLKLHAGGPKDAWDVESLLEVVGDRREIERAVDETLPRLPAEGRKLWARLRGD